MALSNLATAQDRVRGSSGRKTNLEAATLTEMGYDKVLEGRVTSESERC